MLADFKVILWDFDGVLMDSNAVRDLGFEKVLAEFPPEQVAALLDYHRKNGGLSRYVKFRYFFQTIRNEPIKASEIMVWAGKFSEIMRQLLVNPDLLIEDSMAFVRAHYHEIPMHIVSGSDQEELRFLCQEMGIDQYFVSIQGSPTPKIELVTGVLTQNAYSKENTVLVGDSLNDLDAALNNGINFIGYNNLELKNTGLQYIVNFKNTIS